MQFTLAHQEGKLTAKVERNVKNLRGGCLGDFSIIHRKQFYSFMRYRENPVTSTNSRIRNLLHTAGLENRGLEFGTRKIKELPDIDYAPHMKMLQQEIEKSKEFLQKSIRGEYRGEV